MVHIAVPDEIIPKCFSLLGAEPYTWYNINLSNSSSSFDLSMPSFLSVSRLRLRTFQSTISTMAALSFPPRATGTKATTGIELLTFPTPNGITAVRHKACHN